MSEYYVWAADKKAKAQAMLDAINGDELFPIVGNNAATGLPAPDKCHTERWCDAVIELDDGRHCFPRVPAAMMDKHGVPKAKRDALLALHQPAIVDSSTLPFRRINTI